MLYVEIVADGIPMYAWFRNIEEISNFIDQLTDLTDEVGITYTIIASNPIA